MTSHENPIVPPLFDTLDRVRVLIAGHEPMQTAIKRVVAADGITRQLNGQPVDVPSIVVDTIEATRHAAALQIMGVVYAIENNDPTVVARIDVDGLDTKTMLSMAEWIAGSRFAELKSALAVALADD